MIYIKMQFWMYEVSPKLIAQLRYVDKIKLLENNLEIMGYAQKMLKRTIAYKKLLKIQLKVNKSRKRALFSQK